MNAKDMLARWKGLQGARSNFDSHWQELADVLLPSRADFTTSQTVGDKRMGEVYDSTPMQARRELSASMGGMMLPVDHRWFNMRALDDDLEDDQAVGEWLDHVEEAMWTAIYDPKAKFLDATGEALDDLVTFGTAVIFITTNALRDRLLFQTFHLRDCWVAESHEGAVDTMFLRRRLTARQASQKGYQSERIKEALDKNAPETECEYLNVIAPRNDRNPRLADKANMPFGHWVIDPKEEKVVEESGFEEFPFAVPRWDTAAGEVYGRSPGMMALPDVRTLNEQRRTTLATGQKVADPPMAITSESTINERSFQAGGFLFFDPTKQGNSRSPAVPVFTGANLPITLEMENQTREMIWACFLRNVLTWPVDAPQKTATEVLHLREQMMRVVVPTFGRQERDLNGAIANRVFGIMSRANAFDEPPEALIGRRVDFEFRGAVQQAQKRIDQAAIMATLEQLAPLAALKPEMLDNVNFDELARSAFEANGAPHKVLFGKDQVAQTRQARAQAAQAEEVAQGVERAAMAAGAAAPMAKVMTDQQAA